MLRFFQNRKNENLQYLPIVEQINALESEFESMSDENLRTMTGKFRLRIRSVVNSMADESAHLDAETREFEKLLPEIYATVREASKRTIGLRHNDMQLYSGIVLYLGKVAEIAPGEGKTLASTLALYLHALTGRNVHFVTLNDYLARRDAREMAPIFQMLGMSVGILQSANITENGKKAFVVDFENDTADEDRRYMRLVNRKEAYHSDILYGTYSEFGFDYLRDNMAMGVEDQVQNSQYYAVIDEVDSILLDEARTPLNISGSSQTSGDNEWWQIATAAVKKLQQDDCEIDKDNGIVRITDIGTRRLEQYIGLPLNDLTGEGYTPEQDRINSYLEQALRAQFLYQRNRDYIIKNGKIVIIDRATDRPSLGRQWQNGLHQAIEAKEGLQISPENTIYATITLHNYFQMYKKIGGMTNSAVTDSAKFNSLHNLQVVSVPTFLAFQTIDKKGSLREVEAKDEDNIAYSYLVDRADPNKIPIFYNRKDYPDIVFRTREAKLRAVVTEVIRYHVIGRPILIGTTSVESSEQISLYLRAEPLRRMMQIALVCKYWMNANNRKQDGRLIPELVMFNEPIEKIPPDVLRKFIQPFGIPTINPEDATNLAVILEILQLNEQHEDRLKLVLQKGIPHQILNSRKYADGEQIIAGAGAFGAVTIATSLVGFGKNILLGGEISEELISVVDRVLLRAGFQKPFELTLEERHQAILNLNSSQFGVYETEIKLFTKYFDEKALINRLGGLHIMGFERHESRRLDNHLRSFAAIQGDPGSCQFFASLEDDLLLKFGGDETASLRERLKVDDTLPIESKAIVSLVEKSQERAEQIDFNTSKLLIDYDNVLDDVRNYVYALRNDTLRESDLVSKLNIFLGNEIRKRVEYGLYDEEGAWKLVAWLEQIQPPLMQGDQLFPSFGLSLLLKEINMSKDFQVAILDLISRAIEAENRHQLYAIESLIGRTEATLQTQISDYSDALDAYFENLRGMTRPLRPQKILEEINILVGMQLNLNEKQLQALSNASTVSEDEILSIISTQLTLKYVSRVIAAIQNRIGETLNGKFETSNWDEAADQILIVTKSTLELRRERLVGRNGQIARDIGTLLPHALNDTNKLQLLLTLSQGSRTVFDQRTHRQVKQVFSRFSYIFYEAQLLEGREANDLAEEIIKHLEMAEDTLRYVWGRHQYERHSLSGTRLVDFGPAINILGGKKDNDSVNSLSESDQQKLILSLGSITMNETIRHLLLSIITEHWVNLLSNFEKTRISVSAGAYIENDLLSEFKIKVSDVLTSFLDDVQAGVISRIFTYQSKRPETTPVEESKEVFEARPSGVENERKKRRRH